MFFQYYEGGEYCFAQVAKALHLSAGTAAEIWREWNAKKKAKKEEHPNNVHSHPNLWMWDRQLELLFLVQNFLREQYIQKSYARAPQVYRYLISRMSDQLETSQSHYISYISVPDLTDSSVCLKSVQRMFRRFGFVIGHQPNTMS